MQLAGMRTWIDAAGNLRGIRTGHGPRLAIGSHLDTVPNAGPFDGILGVVLGIALAEMTGGVPIEVIGFSEEEGVRFGVPFIGSRAVAGTLDEVTLDRGIGDAIRAYGLDPSEMPAARIECSAYLEFHIEQGPVLDDLGLPLGVVEGILGQSRASADVPGPGQSCGDNAPASAARRAGGRGGMDIARGVPRADPTRNCAPQSGPSIASLTPVT